MNATFTSILLILVSASLARAEALSLSVTHSDTLSLGTTAKTLAVALSPGQGRYVLVGDDQAMLTAFDAGTGAVLWQTKAFERFQIGALSPWSLEFSPSGRFVAAGIHLRKGLVLLDGATGSKLRDFEWPAGSGDPSGGCRTLAFSPDDRYLACGDGGSFRVLVYETETGRLVHNLRRGDNVQYDLEFSADQKLLFQVGFREVNVWNLMTDEHIREIAAPRPDPLAGNARIEAADLSADGRFAAIASVAQAGNGNQEAAAIAIVNLESDRVVRLISVEHYPYRLMLGPDGDSIYAFFNDKVRSYSIRLGEMTGEGTTGRWWSNGFFWSAGSPVPIRFAPGFDRVYTPDTHGVRIWQIVQTP